MKPMNKSAFKSMEIKWTTETEADSGFQKAGSLEKVRSQAVNEWLPVRALSCNPNQELAKINLKNQKLDCFGMQ